MFWLKACPRCHGDLNQERDSYGAFVACIQCSYILNDVQEAQLGLRWAGDAAWKVAKSAAAPSARALAA